MHGWFLTKRLISDLDVPQIDSQVVRGHERLLVTVEWDWVYVIGVSVGKNSFRYGLDLDAVHVFDDWYAYGTSIAIHVVTDGYVRRRRKWRRWAAHSVQATRLYSSLIAFADFPQFHRFVVGREEKVRHVFALEPFDFIYFFLDFQRF